MFAITSFYGLTKVETIFAEKVPCQESCFHVSWPCNAMRVGIGFIISPLPTVTIILPTRPASSKMGGGMQSNFVVPTLLSTNLSSYLTMLHPDCLLCMYPLPLQWLEQRVYQMICFGIFLPLSIVFIMPLLFSQLFSVSINRAGIYLGGSTPESPIVDNTKPAQW